MKKFLIAILSLLYLGATTGATIHLHYCMGRLADTVFFEQKGGHCALCGMEKTADEDNGCCTDEEEIIKISIDQQHSSASFFHFEQPFSLLEPVITGFHPQWLTLTGDKVHPVSNAPPRSPQVPTYLMNCLFRI